MKEDFSRKLRRHKRLWKVIREEDKYFSRQQRFDRWYFFLKQAQLTFCFNLVHNPDHAAQ